MKNQKGFSLIELLIVVAIILIIAAVAIPSLLRARIAANEAGAAGDTRTVISANETYRSSTNGYASDLLCLNDPTICGDPMAGTLALLDIQIADIAELKSGFEHTYEIGPVVTGSTFGHVVGFSYGSEPETPGRTGLRSFCGDYTGLLVHGDAAATCCAGWIVDTAACTPITQAR